MRKSILSIAAILLSCTVFAQNDTLKAVVNVNNEYNPVLIKVEKKSFVPSTANKVKKSTPKYNFTSEAMPFNGFVSERNNKELIKEQNKPYKGYARAGYGIGNDVDVKAAYRSDLSTKDNIKVTTSFDGYMTEIERPDNSHWDSRMYNSNIGIEYAHKFKGLKFGVTGEFNNRVFNYQGTGFIHNVTDKQNSMDYGLRIHGTTDDNDSYGYRFSAGFNGNSRKYSTGYANSISENRINVGGEVWYIVGHNQLRSLGVMANVETFLYNSMLRNANSPYSNYCSIDVDPYINFLFGGWEIRLGTRMNILTGNGAAFAIAPDVKVSKSIGKNISFFVKATGGRTDNNFSKLEGISPYWNFDKANSKQLKPTYKVLDATAGSGITYKSLSVDVAAGYAYTKDDVLQNDIIDNFSQYSFVYTNLAQDDTHNAHASIRVGYDVGGWLRIAGDARYDYWKCDNKELLMMRPEMTCNINAEVKPVRDFTFNLGYNFTCYTKSIDNKRINHKNYLSLRAGYDILPWLGIYLQGNNLLGENYYEYAGYQTRGARGLIGVTANF